MRITTKDLIQTGIFTAVYAVVYMTFNMTGAIAPVLQFIIGPVAILINGITFMLFLSRVRTPLGPLIMVGLLGVLLVVTGHHFVTLFTCLVAGAIASWLATIWPPTRRRSRPGPTPSSPCGRSGDTCPCCLCVTP